MTRIDPAESPLETAAGAVGSAATEAFKVLGNETRLAILLALWEAHEPFAEDDAVAFSDLLERVDYDTSSNFSYHLEKIEGHFVESTEDGYRLRQAGHEIVRAVVAGAGITNPSLEPTPIDFECVFCGAPVEIAYGNEHLHTFCSECEGSFETDSTERSGTILELPFEPAGLSGRDAEELFAAGIYRSMGKFMMQMGGLCPECSGTVESSMHVCEDHRSAEGEICPNCDRQRRVQARWTCTVCKNAGHAPPGGNLFLHPRVQAFHVEHGLEIGYDTNTFERIKGMIESMSNRETEVVSTEPLRLRVTLRAGGDELRLTIDESMNVIDVGT